MTAESAHAAVRWPTVAVAATGLFIATGGPSVQLTRWFDTGSAGWEGWAYLYLFGAVAIVGAALCGQWLRHRSVRAWPWPLWAIVGLVGWALLSAQWSVSAGTTPVRALTAVGVAAFGCWLALDLRGGEQIWAVALAAGATAVASVLAVLISPAWGKMPYVSAHTPGGEWRGIFGNRNGLSPIAVIGLVSLAALVAAEPTVRRIAFATPVTLMYVLILVKTGGATSLLACAAAAVVGALVPLVWWLRRRGVPGWAVAGGSSALTVAGAAVLFARFDWFTSLVGRDPTLTGRRIIWADVRQLIAVHPWRGYGYWSFWERPDLTAGTYAHLGKAYGSAHNSVLEVALGLGAVGLAFYLAVVMFAVVGVAVFVWQGRSVVSWFWAMLLAGVLTESSMESFVLWHSYIWILCVAAALVLFGRRTIAVPTDHLRVLS